MPQNETLLLIFFPIIKSKNLFLVHCKLYKNRWQASWRELAKGAGSDGWVSRLSCLVKFLKHWTVGLCLRTMAAALLISPPWPRALAGFGVYF
jgi:hypothetical protein